MNIAHISVRIEHTRAKKTKNFSYGYALILSSRN